MRSLELLFTLNTGKIEIIEFKVHLQKKVIVKFRAVIHIIEERIVFGVRENTILGIENVDEKHYSMATLVERNNLIHPQHEN